MTNTSAERLWETSENCLFVAYDNADPPQNMKNLNLEKGWGFSVAMKYHEKKILFDCGWSASVLKNNLEALNIPSDFDYIIISHKHWDHTGGLSYVVDNSPDAEIYLPSDFSDNLTKELKKRVSAVYRLKGKTDETPVEIVSGLFVTGDTKGKGGTGEQTAVIKASKFNLQIVGCLHPGLRALYRLACEAIEPDAIIGGVHGFKDIKYLKKTTLKHLYIGHCTQYPELFENIDGMTKYDIYPGFFLQL